jgi:phosphoribosylanthranilate isomerase
VPARIKICGITRTEDARIAANLGVDALGFIFCSKSPRCISPADARAIIETLPAFVTRVGVFVNETAETIMAIARECGINTIQLHGQEPAELIRQLPLPVIKAFGVGASFDLNELDHYPTAGYLLDTWDNGASGGTGRTFDWSVARRAVNQGRTVILAGGLGPTNLLEALDEVQPYAVDVNSGVEVRPGEKNPHKMREAIRIVKEWKKH